MRPQFLNPKTSSNAMLIILLLLVVFVIIGPFLSIWALNTLFPALAIPYTLETWLAMAVMHLLIKGNVTKNDKQ